MEKSRQASIASGGYTDFELVAKYRDASERGDAPLLGSASDSGIRSRRKELVDAGYLCDGRIIRTNQWGRDCTVWQITKQGTDLVRSMGEA